MRVAMPCTLAFFTLISLGCGGSEVIEAFRAAEKEALRKADPAPAGWKPDLVVHLSEPLLKKVTDAALEQAGPIKHNIKAGFANADATMTVKRLTLGPSTRCPSCLAVDAKLDGDLAWAAGILGNGTVPFTADVGFDAAFATAATETGTWAITVEPRDIRDVKVNLGNLRAEVRQMINQPLRELLDKELFTKLQPVTIGEVGGVELPLRAARVSASGKTLRLEALTDVPDSAPVSTAPFALAQGFQVDAAPNTLLAIAKRAIFTAGPDDMGMVPEPTSLSFEGDRFTLGLRLWRISGGKWWRDYTASGTVKPQGRRILLKAEGVEEGGRSKGAVAADPLLFLAEGIILRSIEGAMTRALPAVTRSRQGAVGTEATITGLRGEAGVFKLTGDVTLRALQQGGRR